MPPGRKISFYIYLSIAMTLGTDTHGSQKMHCDTDSLIFHQRHYHFSNTLFYDQISPRKRARLGSQSDRSGQSV